MPNELVPSETIENKIYLMRGMRVMLDHDLAKLYEVRTKNLNKAVQRNLDRFPPDFMFQLTKEECEVLRFHFGTSNLGPDSAVSSRGGRRYLPYAFTEQGVSMLSSVLKGKRAAQVNIAIMRAFVKLRQILSTHVELRRKIEEMENKYDGQFKVVFDAIRELMAPPPAKQKKIGFLK
jgi:hypothetical protein